MSNFLLDSVEEWSGGKIYQADDCVFYKDELYFCVYSNNADPLSSDGWVNSEKFIWQPTLTSPARFAFLNKLSNFAGVAGASIIQKDRNKSSFIVLDLTFKNRSEKQALCILAFLTSKKGNKSFSFDYYTQEKTTLKVRCKTFSHTYVSFNNYDIEAQFEETL